MKYILISVVALIAVIDIFTSVTRSNPNSDLDIEKIAYDDTSMWMSKMDYDTFMGWSARIPDSPMFKDCVIDYPELKHIYGKPFEQWLYTNNPALFEKYFHSTNTNYIIDHYQHFLTYGLSITSAPLISASMEYDCAFHHLGTFETNNSKILDTNNVFYAQLYLIYLPGEEAVNFIYWLKRTKPELYHTYFCQRYAP